MYLTLNRKHSDVGDIMYTSCMVYKIISIYIIHMPLRHKVVYVKGVGSDENGDAACGEVQSSRRERSPLRQSDRQYLNHHDFYTITACRVNSTTHTYRFRPSSYT